MKTKTLCIAGGSGFVGLHLATEALKAGYRVRVVTRGRAACRRLLVLPQVEIAEVPTQNFHTLCEAFSGAHAVVNLVGILNESGDDGRQFEKVHVGLAGTLAEAARAAGVRRYLHMSALRAAPQGPSHYLQSKGRGEARVHALHGDGFAVTSLRPSVIFGPEDRFLNRFADLLRLSPWVFPLTCARARFQPVYVGDVVATFLRALVDPRAVGGRFDVVGPEVLRLYDIVAYVQRLIGTGQTILTPCDRHSRMVAEVMEHVPGKPFSRDNFRSCQIDNVWVGEHPMQTALGRHQTSLDAVVPAYLGARVVSHRYDRLREVARRGIH
jgi:NADH dehydrogenase